MSSAPDLTKSRLQLLIEESRKKLAEQKVVFKPSGEATLPDLPPFREATIPDLTEVVDTDPNNWLWNPEQEIAIKLARTRASFNLIGAAGTGKTTTEREIARILVAENLVPPIDISTKYLAHGTPGIVFTSFTRRAVRNMRRVVSSDLEGNCITLHKLLEYEPVFYEVWDETEQKMRSTMRFEPARNNLNKLPATLKTIVIDESSMVSTELFLKLLAALPSPTNVQFIFVGDLHQLPPVYGTAILGFKLLELPTVELVRIYRQAAKSPIISLAHKIKNGENIPVSERSITENEQGKVTLHPWKKPISDFDATHTCSIFLRKLVKEGGYDEENDIILCPQEKTKNLAFGTNEFNKVIAQELGSKRGAVVTEVIAGYIPHYLAVGDRLLVGREDAIITKISKNAKYWGKRPRPASIELDRWGNYKKKVSDNESGDDFDLDKYLDSFSLKPDEVEDRKQEASHLIDVELLDSGITETLSTAGEINATQFAYCLTVHKSQGAEWPRVFFLTHQSHVVMWSRELLYTAVTRARKELYCIVEPDRGAKSGTLTKAAKSPRIKGDTLAEKAEYFKGKQEEWQDRVDAVGELEQGGVGRGVFKGKKEQVWKPLVPERPPVKLVRLGELVSELFKREAQEKLDEYWKRAEMIWGAAKIGEKPRLDCTLQRGRIVGLASYNDNCIYLNALWCIVADDNEAIRREMLHDTIPHEVAHFINHRYSTPKGTGHDGGWVMAAKLLGMSNPKETTSEFPEWAGTFVEVVEEVRKKLAAEKNADTTNDTSIIIGAEA